MKYCQNILISIFNCRKILYCKLCTLKFDSNKRYSIQQQINTAKHKAVVIKQKK